MPEENSNKGFFQTFSHQEISEFLIASVARWDEHGRMLAVHEQKCQELSQIVKVIAKGKGCFWL